MAKAIMHVERFRYIARRKWRYFKIYTLCIVRFIVIIIQKRYVRGIWKFHIFEIFFSAQSIISK